MADNLDVLADVTDPANDLGTQPEATEELNAPGDLTDYSESISTLESRIAGLETQANERHESIMQKLAETMRLYSHSPNPDTADVRTESDYDDFRSSIMSDL